jgi:hypothetical protein
MDYRYFPGSPFTVGIFQSYDPVKDEQHFIVAFWGYRWRWYRQVRWLPALCAVIDGRFMWGW